MIKRGQVTVFVIIAIILVAGIVVYFVLRDSSSSLSIPIELKPVFDYYQSCIEQEARTAIDLANIQGGRVVVNDYSPGSEWAPFSSHLNFLGSPVPYWYYISANGVIKEQVPLKSEIEKEISDYVAETVQGCDFESYYIQGFEIKLENPVIKTTIEDEQTNLQVNAKMVVSKGDKTATQNIHNAQIKTKLGKFYNLAREIYSQEKSETFLEKYAVDVLHSYAPVDGVEIQCAPKVWSTPNVISDIKSGLEQNFQTIKFNGDYYTLNDKKREYFVVDQSVDESINVLYSSSWPTKVEISGEGVDDQIMMAEGLGTQEGLGAMGFCYVPYHFVYDVSFPALIQIYNNDELFQFPITVIIDNNVAREADLTTLPEEEDFDLCKFKTKEIEVNLYDTELNNVDANVSYECFNQRCRLGQSVNGKLVADAPACVNGFIQVRTEGYAEKRFLFSSNEETFADIILEREYELNVSLYTGSQDTTGTAIVSFVRDDGKTYSISYPAQTTIKLSEGNYETKVYVYGNSSLIIPESTKTQCTNVPSGGLLGFFGSTKEQCFEVKIPKQKVDYALIGGGTSQVYILDSWLKTGKIRISVDKFPSPTSIDQLQQNFELFETKEVEINFDEN